MRRLTPRRAVRRVERYSTVGANSFAMQSFRLDVHRLYRPLANEFAPTAVMQTSAITHTATHAPTDSAPRGTLGRALFSCESEFIRDAIVQARDVHRLYGLSRMNSLPQSLCRPSAITHTATHAPAEATPRDTLGRALFSCGSEFIRDAIVQARCASTVPASRE